ncbi:MAG: hypothetical protein MUF76_13440 [Hydrogenophaga sp.]|nr:hypothetical protein [Hydrogenophaga sp.]
MKVPGQTPDATTLFYSGKLGSTDSWKVAEKIGEISNGRVVTIGQTELGALQNSKEFKDGLRQVLGKNRPELLREIEDGVRPDGSRVPSVWDRASERLAQGAKGDVRTITQSAEDSRVFASKELPMLLKNPHVTHINGVDIEQYRHIYALAPGSPTEKLSEVNKAVQHSSFERTREMRLHHTDSLVGDDSRKTLGRHVHQVDSGKLFEGTAYEQSPRLKPIDATIDFQKNPALEGVSLEDAQRIQSGAQQLQEADKALGLQAMQRIKGAAIKGVGVAGTAYGLAEGYGQVEDAADGARSTREQHERGAEAAADLGTRAVVSGGAAVLGGVVGGAGGTAVAPGAGTAAGAILVGGAAAVGAEHAYEKSRLQQLSRWAGRQAGEISYEYFSDEGKLGRRVESLRQELLQTTDESARSHLKAKLHTADEAFKTEVDRNNAYFAGREGIENAWPEMSREYPKLDKEDVVDAYKKRHETQVAAQPSGQSYPQGNERAVRGAFSDAVHERYPYKLPHIPQEDYRTLSPEQLAERHRHYVGEVVQGRRELREQVANKDSHNNVDQGWTPKLAQKRQADRVEVAGNELWRDSGHLWAIRSVYQERGLPAPQLPVELQPKPRTGPASTQAEAGGPQKDKPMPSAPATAPAARLSPVSQQLLQDSEREVAKVAQRHGVAWDPGMQNTCAAVAATAREAGLSRVNLLRASSGQIHLAHYDGVQVRDAWVDAKVAANTPHEQSLHRLERVDVAQQRTAVEPEPSGSAIAEQNDPARTAGLQEAIARRAEAQAVIG